MATEDKWALIMAQWKVGVDSLQADLCALQIKMDHRPPSEGQPQPLSVNNSLAQIREASRLWSIPNGALVRTQPLEVTGIQLDFAQLPHTAIESLLQATSREISDRTQSAT